MSSGPPAEFALSLLIARLTCCLVNVMFDILPEVLFADAVTQEPLSVVNTELK